LAHQRWYVGKANQASEFELCRKDRRMIELRACIDVDDLDRAVAFYRDAMGLTPGRRLGAGWVEMLGASTPIDLLANPPGSGCCGEGSQGRDYRRHWTPVHLDFVVTDVDAAIERVRAGGGTLDRPIQERAWGRMANIADPFGNGFCLLEFRGRGYDAMLEAETATV
jgi:predicted enzyme related to lactoylglutathione lyase